MPLVGLSKHPPPSHSLILPSGQTLMHSPRHFCPKSWSSLEMQNRWQTRDCMLECNDVVDEDEGDTPAFWFSMVLHVSELLQEASASTANLTKWSVRLWFCEPKIPRWTSEACSRHEEIRHQKWRAEKSITMGFPAERTTSVEIRHMHARHEEIRRHSWARHVGLCTCTDRPAPNLVRSKCFEGILQFCVYNLFGTDTCFAWNVFVANTKCLQKHHHHLHIHAENKDSEYFLQLLLSDKYSYIERNFCFSSALPAFKGRIAHLIANPWNFKSLGRCARHAQIYFSLGPQRPV